MLKRFALLVSVISFIWVPLGGSLPANANLLGTLGNYTAETADGTIVASDALEEVNFAAATGVNVSEGINEIIVSWSWPSSNISQPDIAFVDNIVEIFDEDPSVNEEATAVLLWRTGSGSADWVTTYRRGSALTGTPAFVIGSTYYVQVRANVGVIPVLVSIPATDPVSFTLNGLSQTVTWVPTNTTVTASAGTLTPNALATSTGAGTITYSITDAGTTSCTINETSAVLTFTSEGTCTATATAAQTGAYGSGEKTVAFTITRTTQTVSWSPTNTGVSGTSGTVTPSALASSDGDGTINYSLVDAGTTGCTINSATALITYSGAGTCQVQASAAQTGMYEAGSKSVTFTFTSPPPAPSAGSGGSGSGGGGGDGASEEIAPTPIPAPSTSEAPASAPAVTTPIAVPPVVVPNPGSVTASEVSAISPEQIATVAPDVFKTLAPAALRGITPDQAERLTTAQVSNIRPKGAAKLRPATVAALAPANITAMRPGSLARLTPNAVKAMSEEQVQAIRPAAIAKMTSRQLTTMSPSQISSMTSSQLKALSNRQIKALTKSQVSALSKSQKKLLGL